MLGYKLAPVAMAILYVTMKMDALLLGSHVPNIEFAGDA